MKENEAKLQKMKDENKDEYDIRKFEEVLGESHMPKTKGLELEHDTCQDPPRHAEVEEEEEEAAMRCGRHAHGAEARARLSTFLVR